MKPLREENENEPEAAQEQEVKENCQKCGRPMVFRRGRFGNFLGCSGYPECSNTKKLSQGPTTPENAVSQTCEKCGATLVIRRSRFRKLFLACPNYPKCTYATSLGKKLETP
jgi:DNA topoisomerase-1